MVSIRLATLADAAAVTDIYNQGIAKRGATFETQPRTVDGVRTRLQEVERYPLLVAEQDGAVLGWAGLSEYRSRDCYRGIAEFSVYLDAGARGRGIGKQLLHALIDVAREKGFWKVLSRVFAFNQASLGACRASGFREVGTYEKHACLDGHWLDVVIVERLIAENLVAPTTHLQPTADAV